MQVEIVLSTSKQRMAYVWRAAKWYRIVLKSVTEHYTVFVLIFLSVALHVFSDGLKTCYATKVESANRMK